MLRFSEGVNLAIHALGYLAHHGAEGPVNAPHIADQLGVSRDHLKKVMQRLVKVGLVSSLRGPRGGFTLTRSAGEITMLEVVEAIEGKWAPPLCIMGGTLCGEHCVLHSVTGDLHEILRQRLMTTTLTALPKL